ncbi:hypothetical protein [Carboxylicivirga sp. N1Y90]|uniref:hypothetical protein n=1 Tax=Carboxylicivirga fragile TaxID=3417571 RepID=UPI003D34A8AA|nr:hypothetical protein [Marinilabiliaceae bacterium N1Y90]
MEIIIGMASIVLGIVIAIIPYVRRKYFLRPDLTIEIVSDGGLSSPLGLSAKNEVNEEGYIDGNTAIRVFELIWQFRVRITNNSDLIAFYPKLEFNPNGPRFTLIDKLNSLEPIEPAETIELKVEYRKYEEKTGKERTNVGKEMPSEFNDLGLLLCYQSPRKSTFYTLYDYNGDGNKNNFINKRPKEYKKN